MNRIPTLESTRQQNMPATLLCDFYKIAHREQYPKLTELIYSTWIPRSNKHYPSCNKVITFGPQKFVKKYLINYFNENFFNRPKEKVVAEYVRYLKYCLFVENPSTQHIEDLWELGYLPLKIKALKEGTRCPLRVPMLTVQNTNPKFFWLTNYIETLASCELWQMSTTATIADRYKKIFDEYARKTVGNIDFTIFQGHDFSMRGGAGLEAAASASSGHLLSFVGTDTIPAIGELEKWYNANIETELVGTSIPATEHSVMCALIFHIMKVLKDGGEFCGIKAYNYPLKDLRTIAELAAVKHLITVIYPTGMVSIVSDTFNLWEVLTFILPELKNDIMTRDGKVVIRPDSGNPVDIICGYQEYEKDSYDDDDINEEFLLANQYFTKEGKVYKSDIDGINDLREEDGSRLCLSEMWDFNDAARQVEGCEVIAKGVISLLYDTFGGTVNDLGYIELDPHIGAIYGDAITPERATEIFDRLLVKQFASTNIVFGIGSFTYQYITRDTFGFAMKSTLCAVEGDELFMCKDPVTDDGTKKSLTGGCVVVKHKQKGLVVIDHLFTEDLDTEVNQLRTIFKDGKLLVNDDLAAIRERLNSTR